MWVLLSRLKFVMCSPSLGLSNAFRFVVVRRIKIKQAIKSEGEFEYENYLNSQWRSCLIKRESEALWYSKAAYASQKNFVWALLSCLKVVMCSLSLGLSNALQFVVVRGIEQKSSNEVGGWVFLCETTQNMHRHCGPPDLMVLLRKYKNHLLWLKSFFIDSKIMIEGWNLSFSLMGMYCYDIFRPTQLWSLS